MAQERVALVTGGTRGIGAAISKGLSTLCIGGGMGIALTVER